MSFDCSALSVRQWIHALTSVEIFTGPLQACLEHIQVVAIDSVVSEIDTIVSSHG